MELGIESEVAEVWMWCLGAWVLGREQASRLVRTDGKRGQAMRIECESNANAKRQAKPALA